MKVIQLHNNEKRLIKKALKKDRKAQQSLYETYSPKMLSVCRMYVKDLHFAEDVMLKGFFKVFNNLSNFRSEGSFEGWIRKIMVREAGGEFANFTGNKAGIDVGNAVSGNPKLVKAVRTMIRKENR